MNWTQYFYLVFFLFLQDHSHTPWIIIVAKYLEKWLSEVLFHFQVTEILTNMFKKLKMFNGTGLCWYITQSFWNVAQLSASKKLQGKRGLQAVHKGRYVWTLDYINELSAWMKHFPDWLSLKESERMRMVSLRMKKTLKKPLRVSTQF